MVLEEQSDRSESDFTSDESSRPTSGMEPFLAIVGSLILLVVGCVAIAWITSVPNRYEDGVQAVFLGALVGIPLLLTFILLWIGHQIRTRRK